MTITPEPVAGASHDALTPPTAESPGLTGDVPGLTARGLMRQVNDRETPSP